jgi:hypothetical protein
MAKELIVSVNGREKKIAIVENEKVTEFYIERGEGNQGIVGNIYKGRVMRVLPGMQSAFVDVGLERDAFLYVSDFFDEEEEFERIVIDKSQKGNVEEAQRVAAEQIALARVERERHIEATHERVEPLRDMEPDEAMEIETESSAEPTEEQPTDSGDSTKRRSRRGRRRRGGRDVADTEDAATPSQTRIRAEDIDTPFVAADPSIQRIVDEEETAATGEMFKDARLQERLFDQIHAGEFNLEDDFRTAEVGSVLSSVDYRDDSFQRVDDGDNAEAEVSAAPRLRETIAAHIESFVDDFDDNRLQTGSFQRVSDDDAESERASVSAGTNEIETKEAELAEEEPPQERTTTKKSRVGKLLSSLGAKKKTPTKRSSTKKAAKEPVSDADAAGPARLAPPLTPVTPTLPFPIPIPQPRKRRKMPTDRSLKLQWKRLHSLRKLPNKPKRFQSRVLLWRHRHATAAILAVVVTLATALVPDVVNHVAGSEVLVGEIDNSNPQLRTCCVKGRKYWSRLPRNRSPKKARASLRTSPCLAGF